MFGGTLFQTWITRTAKQCAGILILESGQYNLRECHLVETPDSRPTVYGTGRDILLCMTNYRESRELI